MELSQTSRGGGGGGGPPHIPCCMTYHNLSNGNRDSVTLDRALSENGWGKEHEQFKTERSFKIKSCTV